MQNEIEGVYEHLRDEVFQCEKQRASEQLAEVLMSDSPDQSQVEKAAEAHTKEIMENISKFSSTTMSYISMSPLWAPPAHFQTLWDHL